MVTSPLLTKLGKKFNLFQLLTLLFVLMEEYIKYIVNTLEIRKKQKLSTKTDLHML